MNPFLIVLRSVRKLNVGRSDAPHLNPLPYSTVMLLTSLPAYRFFPLLMIYSVVLVCVLGRDFGPMLAAERRSQPLPSLNQPDASPSTDVELTPPTSEDSSGDFTGQYAWLRWVVHSDQLLCLPQVL